MYKFKPNFRLSKPNSKGKSSVVIRVSFKGKRTDLYTGIVVYKDQWSEKKERIKHGCFVNGFAYNVLNELLSQQEQFVERYFNSETERKGEPSLLELKKRFNYVFKQSNEAKSNEFFYLFDKYIDETSQVRNWGKDMKTVAVRVKNKLRSFKGDICFMDLSTETMNKFTSFLSVTMYNDALKKHLSYFKQFVMWAKSKGYIINEEYFGYNPKLPTSKKAVRYLTHEELNTIIDLPLEEFSSLDKTRDFFVFQCFTALRYSDLAKLKHENITKNEDGIYYIEILTEKDDDRVKYQLANVAVSIYEKYKEFQYQNDLVFPVISNQKYNDHLKEIGKLADLQGEWIDYEYKLNQTIVVKVPKCDLQSHTARRTFVVTALNLGVSTDLISLITSHSDYNAMKPYIKANTSGTDKVISAINQVRNAT